MRSKGNWGQTLCSCSAKSHLDYRIGTSLLKKPTAAAGSKDTLKMKTVFFFQDLVPDILVLFVLSK